MKGYKEVTPQEMQELVEKAHEATCGAQAATGGPEKLDPQLAELLAAVEDEFRRLKMQIADLQRQIGPWNQFLHNRFDEEVDRKLGRKNQFMDGAKVCEATPMQQFKYKYNV